MEIENSKLKITERLAPSAVVVGVSDIQIGSRFARTLFVTSYPRYLNTSWFSPIINLDREMDISMFIHPEDTASMLKKLRDQLGRLEAQAMEEQAAGKVRDPALDTGISDIESLRDRLQQGTERLFNCGIYITLLAPDRKGLEEAQRAVQGMLDAQLVSTKPATFRMEEAMTATMPLCMDTLAVHSSLNTEPLSSLFPFVSYDLTHDKGLLYGINLHNNSLVLFDRFALENANTVILGKSGGGKSIVGSESVLIRNNGRIEMAQIGQFIEQIIANRGATKIDEELEGVIDPGVDVWAFDNNNKGSWSRVSVAARKKAPKDLYRFTTMSGRMITTTGDHNLVILKNGCTVIAKSSEVEKGNFVPLPRVIESATTLQPYINLLDLLRNSKNIYVLGADILIRQNYHALHTTQIDSSFDRYLYKYRDGRPVPIGYFLRILEILKIDTHNPELEKLKLASRLQSMLSPVIFHFSESFAKLLGYIVSEGTTTQRTIQISNLDPEVLSDISAALRTFNVKFYYGNRAVIIADILFVEIAKAFGCDKKSASKDVAPYLFNARKSIIGTYLRAYFEGDGGVEHASVVAVSKSKKLISELCYLLYYFGIVARIKKTKKKTAAWTRKKSYWKLIVSGQSNLRKFAEEINFVSERKKVLLSTLCLKKENTNVDIVPELATIFQELSKFLPANHGITDLSPLKRGVFNPSPKKILEITEKIEKVFTETFSGLPVHCEQLLLRLRSLATNDLFWDPIVKIQKIKNIKEQYVYDLTVDNEVFLAGHGGLFVHNSYTVKLEILRSMMFGTQVFVIDPENEYQYLADMVGGTSAKISISSEDHINPFDLPTPRPDETTADVLRSHVVNLSGFFKLLLGGVTAQEDSILDEAIRQTYASRDITPESDLRNVTAPLLTDFQSVLSGMQGTESLSVRIKKYTEGSFGGFLNNPTNIKLDNQLVAFSIRDMEEELKPIAMYLVLNFIWTQIRSELKQRLLVVDEAWIMMRSKTGGLFLSNIAKRARKYYLGVTAISQDIPDFMNSEYGPAIVSNSSLQILLKQSPSSIDLVKNTFHLTEAEKFFLLEAQVGHGLFFAGTSHVAIRIVASYAEDQIITSDPRQLLEIEAAKRELAR